MTAMERVRRAHMARIALLGSPPPWWRVFKRRRWVRRARIAATEMVKEMAAALVEDVWNGVGAVRDVWGEPKRGEVN